MDPIPERDMSLRSFARLASTLAAVLVLAGLSTAPLAAQTGSSVDWITGTITDETGKPIAGAGIEAYSIELDVTKKATTNDKGRYSIPFNDGGGRYRVTVRAIGKTPFISNVSRQEDDDRIVLNVKLGDRPAVLADIRTNTVRAQGDQNERPTPGSTERNLGSDQLARLPIDASDLAALAALVPGVIVTAGSDSTATAFQVAGQSGAANNIVVDGTTNGGTLPQDGIRNTRVITNTFDVSRGQFSGGQVSATTRGGSNRQQGSISGNFRDRNLAFGSATDNVFTAGQTSQQVGAGFGGPLRRDKLFLFGSFNVNRSVNPMASLDAADATTLQRLGASPDSAARFIALANATGLTARVGTVDPNRTQDRFSGSLRFDWNVADRHILTMRGDINTTTSDPTRIGQTQLPQVGGNQSNNGGGLAVSLVSRPSVDLSNEFRAYVSQSNNESTPFLYVPVGRVQSQSLLDDGRVATTTFGFGGNSGLPQESKNKSLEITNNLSLFAGGGAHRFQLGGLLNLQSFEQNVTNNRFGTYTYNTLADFENNTPAQFTRTLQPVIRDGSSLNSAIFLSDVWRKGPNLQFTFGGRLEYSSFGGAPERNADVEQKFGVRTDRLPTETYFTPRLGFSWTIPAAEQQGFGQRGFAPPAVVLRGGVGVFRGTMSSTLPSTAQANAGFLTTESQLVCVGGAVPIPDWNDFATNPGNIPSQCIDNQSTPVVTGRPSVTVYDENFGAAKTIRANLGATRRLNQFFTVTLDGSYVKGIGQSGARDLNLNLGTPFLLANEGNRPVFIDPSLIVPGTGAIPFTATRKDLGYGSVEQVFSGLENETKQITASMNWFNTRGSSLSANYTMQFARDQAGGGGGRGGGGGGNLTPGNPNEFLWARSANERRHNIQLNFTKVFSPTFEISAIGSMASGSRYSPTVSGDINGDGSRNDLAYVFDPATVTDPAIAAAMERLLSDGSKGGVACLKSQLGKVAERNSCVGPWQPSLNLQVNLKPAMFQNRLTISFATINLLGGLDELFNGANNLKGWGGFARPDATLLQVNGFDPATNRYVYTVNERFGATGGAATAVRSPFQVGVNMRYVLGFDQRREMQRMAFGQGNGAGVNAGTTFIQQMLANLPFNAAQVALERKDSLVLAPKQIEQLQAFIDSTSAAMQPAIAALEEAAKTAGSNTQALFPQLAPIAEAFQLQQIKAIEVTKRVLTDVQWSLMPESAKSPAGFGQIMRPGGNAPGGAGRPVGGAPARGGGE
jgi:hypothetical protein